MATEKVMALPTKFGRQYLIVDQDDVDLVASGKCRAHHEAGRLHFTINHPTIKDKQIRLQQAIAARFLPVIGAAKFVGFRNGMANDFRRGNLYRANKVQIRYKGGAAHRQDMAKKLLQPGWTL